MNKQVNTIKEKQNVFAEGLSFYKITWCFIIASIFGTYYEEILTYFKHGVLENRSAVIIGPFNPLYGTAYIIAIFLFVRFKNPFKVIFLGAIFGGSFEYLSSIAQEYFTGSVSWNYENLLLDINGRTTIPLSLLWGSLVYIFVTLLYPHFSKAIEKIPYRFGIIFTNIFIVFITLNMFVTYSMLIRQGLRVKGVEPYTFLGEIYDEVFTDEYIQELFPNMVLKESDEDD